MVNLDTFEGVIVSLEDFENFDEYNILNEEQQKFIWTYAKSNMSDMLLQDYELVIEAIIKQGMANFEREHDESYYEQMNHQKLNEDD